MVCARYTADNNMSLVATMTKRFKTALYYGISSISAITAIKGQYLSDSIGYLRKLLSVNQ